MVFLSGFGVRVMLDSSNETREGSWLLQFLAGAKQGPVPAALPTLGAVLLEWTGSDLSTFK